MTQQPYGYSLPQPPQAPYPPQPASAYQAPYGAPVPGYAAAPAYPPPYGPPVAGSAAQPAPPLAHGTIDDFLSQPGGSGGENITKIFQGKAPGTVTVSFLVTRKITNADIRQQTNDQGQPQPGFDGRPLFVMVVPCTVLGATDGSHAALFPDGHASWWVKSQAKDALAQAMDTANAPAGAPEAGARIDLTWTGDRPSKRAGRNPAKQYRVSYTRPAAAPGQPQPALDAAALQAAPPASQPPAPAPVPQEPPAQPSYAPVQAPAPASYPQYAQQSPAPQAAPAAFTQPAFTPGTATLPAFAPVPVTATIAPAPQYVPAAAPAQAPYPPQPYAQAPADQVPGYPAGITEEQARILDMLKVNGTVPAAPVA